MRRSRNLWAERALKNTNPTECAGRHFPTTSCSFLMNRPRLPPGTSRISTRSRFDRAVAMSAGILLIDGYNLLHAAGMAQHDYGPGDLLRCRTRLLKWLLEKLSA